MELLGMIGPRRIFASYYERKKRYKRYFLSQLEFLILALLVVTEHQPHMSSQDTREKSLVWRPVRIVPHCDKPEVRRSSTSTT